MPKDLTQVTPKSRKDKGPPKKALSPYMLFTMEWRVKYKKQHPNVEFGAGQLARMMGTKWKELSEAEKAPYVEKHERDKERAATDKQQHEAQISHSDRKGTPRTITV